MTQPPEHALLTVSSHRTFKGGTDEALSGTTFFFSQDGKAVLHEIDCVAKTRRVSETTTDITRNWSPKPVFGDYSAIIAAAM
jgi:hypothetical protein